MQFPPCRIWIQNDHIPDECALNKWCVNPDPHEMHLFTEYVTPNAWQPIETAPKDGRLIMVAHNESYQNGVAIVRWSENYGAWVDYDNDFWKPDFWMPLPKPPHKESAE
jgi:hypothetical protein